MLFSVMEEQETRKLQRIEAVLKCRSLKNNAEFGRLGEKYARVNYSKRRIPSLTGTAKYRVPNILSETELIEVKNVKYQQLTNQIKDFIAFCHVSNRNFIIYLKDDARLSASLAELAEKGHIRIRPLGIIFTEKAQKRFFKAIKPSVLKVLAKI